MTNLDKLRELMAEHQVDCFVCFHMDAHNSEYIADCDERIKFISGFGGSNGICVVTKTDAKMWTDGRYYLAALKELTQGWEMMKMEANLPTWFSWAAEYLKEGQKIGFDHTQYPVMACELRTKFFNDKKIEVVSTPNLVDLIWGADRPLRPQNPVFHLETKFTGEETLAKYERVAANLGDADYLLVAALDDIAWLLNLRGCDIEYNPVFFSYLLFSPKTKSAKLYIDEVKVEAVLDYLSKINVSIAPYHQIN